MFLMSRTSKVTPPLDRKHEEHPERCGLRRVSSSPTKKCDIVYHGHIDLTLPKEVNVVKQDAREETIPEFIREQNGI